MSRIILIVEDYEDTRLFMKLLLESYGYEVVEASNGLEALKLLEETSPDLVLMDLAMPLMDGLTATKTIRTIENGNHVPIIAVTAHGKRAYETAIEAGCNDLLEKPVDFDSLRTVLHQYLDQ
jgi:CheY-like chemotaxis protein